MKLNRLRAVVGVAAILAVAITAILLARGGDEATRGNREGEGAAATEGSRIAFALAVEGGSDIFVYHLASGEEWRLTDASRTQTDPSWSPDGTRIVFEGYRPTSGANDGIFIMRADGSGVTEITPSEGGQDEGGQDPDWSPDGSRIVFMDPDDGGIRTMTTTGDDVTVLTKDFNDNDPVWSPDGSMIAFIRRGELFVMNADGSGQRSVTGNQRQAYPAWSPDGSRIAFGWQVDGDTDIYATSPDGTPLERLTSDAGSELQAAWSPAGDEIAYVSSSSQGTAMFLRALDELDARHTRVVSGAITALDWTAGTGPSRALASPR